MPFRPGGEPNYKALQSTLANARVKEKDAPLYNVARNLISGVSDNAEQLKQKMNIGDKIILTDQVSGILPVQYGGSFSGVYTPLLAIVSNLTSASAVEFQYNVVGNTVNVSGMLFLNVPVASTVSAIKIELPILSYFVFEYQCAGQAVSPNFSADSAAILGDTTDNCAVMGWIPPTSGTRNMYLQFMYQVIAINDISGAGGGGGGGGGSCGGGGGGCSENPPAVPLFDGSGIVNAYAAAHPAELANSCEGQGGNNDFINGVIAELQAADPRFGANGKRGNTSDPSQDAVSYYYGADGIPVLGSNCVYVVDVIARHCPLPGQSATPAWINQTNCDIPGAWMPGPI